MKLTLRQRGSFAVLIAGSLSAASLILISITWTRLRSSISRAEIAQTRRLHLEQVLSEVKDVEFGHRGYVITGDESYLATYASGQKNLNATLQKLADVAPGDVQLVETLAPLRRLIGQQIALAETAIASRRDAGLEGDHGSPQRQGLVDSVRARMEDLILSQDEVIRESRLLMRSDLRFGLLAALTSGVAALVSGGVALWLWQLSQKRAERERRLLFEKARAVEADRQKSSFLATMSHEIRTPMNAILGFSELLRAEATNERQRRYSNSIVTAGRALLQLINDVLDISKIEAGRLEIRFEPADLRLLAEFVRTLFAEQAAARGLNIWVKVSDMVPPSVLMDATRLRQILVNVVGNAIKFTETGHVGVRLHAEAIERDPNRLNIRIDIEDTGVGILPEDKDRIFKPFIQGAGTFHGLQPGTGLGLSIVRRLTELMGGTVSLDSERGRGSTFHFFFPDIEISTRPAEREDDEPEVSFHDFAPFHAVVVDDNEANRGVLAEFFEGSPHGLRFACNGREAVEEVEKEKPDIVLMDLRMPEMDGEEALDRIRQVPGCESLPVLALTASSVQREHRGARHKFDGVVRKPFSRARLYRELAHFVPRRPPSESGRNETEVPASSFEDRPTALSADVAGELLRLEKTDWPSLCVTMSITSARAFAERLNNLARHANNQELGSYAERLASDAEECAISSMEGLLAEFPSLVRRLTANVTAPTT
ncbi:MAG: ATP-binding protein [Verrucomicrobiales bacterium]